MSVSSPFEAVSALAGDSMDTFKKLCVLRCIRPDAVVSASFTTSVKIEQVIFDSCRCPTMSELFSSPSSSSYSTIAYVVNFISDFSIIILAVSFIFI